MAEIRAFIAIRLDDELHRQIKKVQERLAGALPERTIRWVAPANIHLTLKFLGDTPAGRIEAIAGAMRAAAAPGPSFTFEVAGLGCFPNARRPRVVWVGLEERSGALAALFERLETETSRLGIEREARGFSPHLTLGRVRQEAPASATREIGSALERAGVGQLGLQRVETICLFQSDLRPTGPIYTLLVDAPLGGRAGGRV